MDPTEISFPTHHFCTTTFTESYWTNKHSVALTIWWLSPFAARTLENAVFIMAEKLHAVQ